MSQATYQAIDRPKQSYRKHKICIGVSICCTVTMLGIAIGFPFLIASLLDGQAKSGIVMTPETEKLWAYIPGATQSITYRNFTFFNFTNPREVLYKGHKPLFREISGYSYLEKQDFLNIDYRDNGNEVKFDFWLRFDEASTTRNVNEKVQVINLGPLGFWYQLKGTDMPTFAVQGFGQLTVELRSTFKTTVLGQGVSQQFLANYSNFVPLATSASLTPALTSFLWNDMQYGLGDPNNYQIWVAAARDRQSADYQILINYFGLEPSQMQVVLEQLKSWLQGLEGIIDNWYCGNGTDTNAINCSSEYLTFLQLSRSGVTASPPPGTAPTDSICEQNVTCTGWPEISSYLKHVFPQQYPRAEDCFNLTFTIEEMRKWMFPSHQSYCLLHAGNMNYLWEQGREFDKSLDIEVLLNIMQRFQLKSFQHTFVFWNWVKYVTHEFVLKQEKQGSAAVAGVGGVASQAFYGVFSAVQDWLGDLLLLAKVADKMQKTYGECVNLTRSIIQNVSSDQTTFICKDVVLSDPSTLLSLVNVCEYEFGSKWTQLQSLGKFSELQMSQLCDRNNPSLETIINLSHEEIAQFYNCSLNPIKRCSNYELTLRQWSSSEITTNPIPELSNKLYPTAQTVKDWNGDIPEFQYSWFLNLIGSNSSFRPSLTNMVELVSFDCLFSGPVIQEIMLELNDTAFEKTYNWSEPGLLRSYLKFLAIEVGLGGITQERSVKELVLGYEDDFLRNLRDMDPVIGGDPSINIVVAINDPNSTRQQAKLYPMSMYTGKDNYNATRYYKTINGVPYTNFNYSYWNGDQVVKDIKSPWTVEDHFVGTDAFQSAPGLKPDSNPATNNISIYISTLYRYGQALYNETITKYDMDVYVARVDPKLYLSQYDNSENAKYYMHYGGFLNISSINGAPLFVSKNHFLDCPKNWSQLIDMYDEKQTFIYEASIWDDTLIQIEPYTGTSFGATIYLQTNYLFSHDQLFERNQTFMLPVFSLWRSGNMSTDAVDEYFGPIKIALKVKSYSLFVGLALAGLALLAGLAVYLRMRKLKKAEASQANKSPDLMISLQPNAAAGRNETQSVEEPKLEDTEDKAGSMGSVIKPLNSSMV